MSSHVDLLDDPDAFLAAAAQHLAAGPVLTTVVATVTAGIARRPDRYADLAHCWWAIARGDDGEVVGVAMRTAPFEPQPVYVLPMPAAAATELARRLHARGEPVTAVNGALPAARVLAEETARLAGRAVAEHERLRLHELGDLLVPVSPPGRLRPAERADADLCLAWFRDFERAAAEQAGRPGDHGPLDAFGLDDILVRIRDGIIWLWEDESGTPVHLTAANLPANGVARIGPVYTPREHRGRGYAARAVAEVSQQHVGRGLRCCLFTDQANPVSNRLYEGLGYRPVVDMVNLLVG